MSRIGPRMRAVVEYVRNNPGCAKVRAAEAVGPHGSRRYGYRSVDRAIRAGLVIAQRAERGNSYRLEIAPSVDVLMDPRPGAA